MQSRLSHSRGKTTRAKRLDASAATCARTTRPAEAAAFLSLSSARASPANTITRSTTNMQSQCRRSRGDRVARAISFCFRGEPGRRPMALAAVGGEERVPRATSDPPAPHYPHVTPSHRPARCARLRRHACCARTSARRHVRQARRSGRRSSAFEFPICKSHLWQVLKKKVVTDFTLSSYLLRVLI